MQQLSAIEDLHRHAFVGPIRGEAELPKLPSFARLLDVAETAHLKGVGMFRRQARQEARKRARAAAERHAQGLLADARADQEARQAELDRPWDALLGNEEEIVLAALESAFEDNQAPAAAVGVVGSTASVAVMVPSSDTLPERIPSTTAAGNLSLKKMTKSQRASWHLQLVAGHVVATAKEALAAAPGLTRVTLVAIRITGGNVEPILVTTIDRQPLEALTNNSPTAWDVVEMAGDGTRVRFKGVAREMAALDVEKESDLAAVLGAF